MLCRCWLHTFELKWPLYLLTSQESMSGCWLWIFARCSSGLFWSSSRQQPLSRAPHQALWLWIFIWLWGERELTGTVYHSERGGAGEGGITDRYSSAGLVVSWLPEEGGVKRAAGFFPCRCHVFMTRGQRFRNSDSFPGPANPPWTLFYKGERNGGSPSLRGVKSRSPSRFPRLPSPSPSPVESGRLKVTVPTVCP